MRKYTGATHSSAISIHPVSLSLWQEDQLSYQTNYLFGLVEERLFYIKIQEIVDEFMQITQFIKKLEEYWFENSETLSQIDEIIAKLRSGDRTYKYTKIVHVLTKYLNGIRDFSTNSDTKSILFYKKLFESTLVAIIQELDSIEW